MNVKSNKMIKLWLLIRCATVLILPTIASADIVYNGGFEFGDFTGWLLSGNPIPGMVDTSNPHTGSYAADLFAAASPAYIEQLLPTMPGTLYNLTYFLRSDGGTPNRFLAQVNNATLIDQINIPSQNYTQYSFSFQAASTSTDLKFGFQNDPGSFYLDDISVTPAPEPAFAWIGVVIIVLAAAKQMKGSRKEVL